MSLYNAICDYNPLAPLLLDLMGLDADDIPRFRDIFVYVRDGTPMIGIYTRTGGGNRDAYETCDGPSNEKLRQLPGFVSDEDDAFDQTFATFWFNPVALRDILAAIVATDLAATERPGTRMKRIIDALNDPTKQDDPDVKRANEVGKGIAEQIMKAMER